MISRKQAELVAAQAAVEKLRECEKSLLAENKKLKVRMISSKELCLLETYGEEFGSSFCRDSTEHSVSMFGNMSRLHECDSGHKFNLNIWNNQVSKGISQ